MERTYTVSQAARELARSERWLRQVDGRGEFPKAKRDENHRRYYTQQDLALLKELIHPTSAD